jgi:hypothetical protein
MLGVGGLNLGGAWGRPLEHIKFIDMKARLSGRPLIKGYLEREQISLLVGDPKCGKTFFALHRDLCISAGCDWFGCKVTQGPVVYLAIEAGRSIENRVVAWSQENGFDRANLPFAVIPTPVDLCHPEAEGVERVVEEIKKTGFVDQHARGLALLEIDTVNRAMAGGDENAPGDMGSYIGSVDRLRDSLRCHISNIHHFGKDAGRGSRGHNSLICAVDTEAQVQNFVATITQQRDNIAGSVFPFKLRQITLGFDWDGDPVTTCIVEEGIAVAAPPPKLNGAKPPSPMARKFHDALLDALSTSAAEIRTNCGKGVSVSQDTWVSELDRLGLLDKGAARNRRSALVSKYRAELIAANWAACNGDFIWSIRKEKWTNGSTEI